VSHEPANTGDIYAPCVAGCPVHTDTREFVECILQGNYEAAAELLLSANPFSSVCGRICHHPCEQQCRRSKIEAPVVLRRLKRFVLEATEDWRLARREHVPTTREQSVAIVGSGPSGLTAAHDLTRRGFRVTVFEKLDSPGGMLGLTIPRYRLPFEILQQDIDDILALGVEMVTGCEVGKDITLGEMKERGYSAILLAGGLSESRTLAVPGIDSEGVYLALPFLRTVRAGGRVRLGARVVVIGGGNVASDVARSARRLGAEKVTMVCLESRQEMPLYDWELEEALEDNVEILSSWGPKTVFTEDGHVRGMELRRCPKVFDENGRFSPSFDDRDVRTLPADSIILAIGQHAELGALRDTGLQPLPGDRMPYDSATMSAPLEGVFACGEMVTGPGAAVEAVADGHRAAAGITHYLETGELLELPEPALLSLDELPEETAERVRPLSPVDVRVLPAEERVCGFAEIEEGYTEAEARAEARRCLACTTGAFVDEERCIGCLTCVRICPFGVATVEETAVMPQEQCQACGLCAAQCPAAAIALKRFGTNKMKEGLRGRFQAAPLAERTAILAGIIVPKSLGMLKYMNSAVAGVSVPQALMDRMSAARKAAGEDKAQARHNQEEEGIKMTVELVQQAREIDGVRGVHIQAIEWEDRVPRIVKEAGLLPRPSPQQALRPRLPMPDALAAGRSHPGRCRGGRRCHHRGQ